MKALVTGGGGFVGGALCRRLQALGHDVTALGRRPHAHLAADGIRTVTHDLSRPAAAAGLAGLFAGMDCVFHTAAHVKMWGPREAFVRGNLQATENVIAACRAAGVAKLVFTSSPSVVAGGHDLRGVDESVPYPARYRALYPETKAAAERAVLAAHGADLRTVALRPHLIFGPGDTNLVPTILTRARAGRLVQVGDGTNLVDLTFIDDCVSAHVLAAAALDARPTAGGRAFFISQGAPVPLWEWIGRVLALHGVPPVQRRISATAAGLLATVAEAAWRTCGLASDPPLTRFLAEEMSTDHYFDIGAARRELGYAPSCTVWEATERSFGRSSPATIDPPPAGSRSPAIAGTSAASPRAGGVVDALRFGIGRMLASAADGLRSCAVRHGARVNASLPHPPAVEPVWPLPCNGDEFPPQRIREAFARFDQVHYPFEFTDGTRIDVRYAAPVGSGPGMSRERPLRRFRHLMPWVLERTGGSLRGLRVLDIACNAGFWSLQAAALGAAEVVGFDGRPGMIEMARLVQRITGFEPIRFETLDFESLEPGALGRFDVVLFLGLLYHLPDPLAALERVRRMAVPGGLMVLDTTTLPSGSPIMHAAWEENVADVRNALQRSLVWFPSPACVEMMLLQAGYANPFRIPLLSTRMPDDYLRGRRHSWIANA